MEPDFEKRLHERIFTYEQKIQQQLKESKNKEIKARLVSLLVILFLISLVILGFLGYLHTVKHLDVTVWLHTFI